MRRSHTSFFLAALGCTFQVSALPRSGYIRRSVALPLGKIEIDSDSRNEAADDPFLRPIRQRKLHKSSKSKSSKSTKSSKSHKSGKGEKVYYVIVHPPPEDSYEDHWTHYDPNPSYYEYYPDEPTEYPTHAHHETERGGMPSLDASPDEPTATPVSLHSTAFL